MINVDLQKLYTSKLYVDIQNKHLDGDIKVDINIMVEEKNETIVYLKVTFTCSDDVILGMILCGEFIIKGVDNTEIDKIARINCTSIMFPFLRERVARLTNDSLLGEPIYLPSVDFSHLYKEWLKKEKNQG